MTSPFQVERLSFHANISLIELSTSLAHLAQDHGSLNCSREEERFTTLRMNSLLEFHAAIVDEPQIIVSVY